MQRPLVFVGNDTANGGHGRGRPGLLEQRGGNSTGTGEGARAY